MFYLLKMRMVYKIEWYSSLCELQKFVINWINADYEDFWEKFDRSPETAEQYWCWNMQFEWKKATQSILDKYKISIDEYNKIVEELEVKLSFWCCWWCI